MKTKTMTIGRAALLGGLISISIALGRLEAGAQGPFPYLAQALGRVAGMGEVVNLSGFDYAPGNSLLGAYLAQRESKTLRLWLQGGTHYVVVGAGDEDILDLDLEARTEAGVLLARDDDVDPVAVLSFTPRDSGWATVRVINYSSLRPGFCAFVALQKTSGSARFNPAQIVQALERSVGLARAAGLVSTRFAVDNFCVFGGRLAEGQTATLINYTLSPGRYVVVTAGSESVTDADLAIIAQDGYDQDHGVTVAIDDAPDPTAICAFEVKAKQYYSIRQTNSATEDHGSGFVFTCLLER